MKGSTPQSKATVDLAGDPASAYDLPTGFRMHDERKKPAPRLTVRPVLLVVVLTIQVFVVCGCTTALWDEKTFARHYRPAVPNNLRLFYSGERKDILVQYDEFESGDTPVRLRCYWLDPNTVRVNEQRKPHFVSADATNGCLAVPVVDGSGDPAQAGLMGLYAVACFDEGVFTLYAGEEELNPYQLPAYKGGSQRLKQVLLTPFAVLVDATIVGAVIAYYSAPEIFASLSQ